VFEGGEHLDAALAHGRGAVLWIADLVFANDIPKIALARRGIRASHLSRPEHGFSATRFGLRWLNPLRQDFELRYLRERIVYDRNDPNAAGETMRARLAENGVVSILACAQEGRAFIEADFLGARLRMAGGAPRLAYESGSALLPVFTMPAWQSHGFCVTVGPPLALDGANRKEAAAAATADFLERLEPLVCARPHLWRGWPSLRHAGLAHDADTDGALSLDAKTAQ
jgi:lauroyl/myristoyl acyltransferase